MLVRVGRMPGEDATRPPIRAADFNEAMGEGAGVPSGEGVGFGGRRAAGFDGPGFELRRQVGSIQVGDGQARRGLAPGGWVKPLREILPRAHRRAPFPEPEFSLTRPTHATGKPARTEVMEERKEHVDEKLASGGGWREKDSSQGETGDRVIGWGHISRA